MILLIEPTDSPDVILVTGVAINEYKNIDMVDPEILKRLNAARTPKAKKPTVAIKPISDKKAKQNAEAKKSGDDDAVYNFFVEMRPSMTGKCLFCNSKSEKHNDETFHFSLAHLLPKSSFPSVATHQDNVIELCYYGESCHSQFDNNKITWEMIFDSAEWPMIREKLLKVLPMVAPNERSQKLYGKVYELVYGKKDN